MTGEELKAYIRAEGYRQAEIAQSLGISQQALRSRLSASSISVSTIEMVARAMHRSPDALLRSPYDEESMMRRELERLREVIKAQEEEIKRLEAIVYKKSED